VENNILIDYDAHKCLLFIDVAHRLEVYSIQHYVIKFVSDLRQVSGFPRVLRFSPSIKSDHYDIAEILLKVALNTTPITQTMKNGLLYIKT